MEIDIGIAAFGHPREMGIHAFPRGIHLDQQPLGLGFVGNTHQPRRIVEQHARFGLDRDMDHYEPVLVRAAEEVLHHADVFESDRSRLVDSRPVVEHIARIGQQWRLIEPVGNRHHRAGEIGGEMRGRRRLAPDIGLHQEGVMHHRGTHLLFGSRARPVFQPRISQLIEPVAHPSGGEQVGEVARRRHHLGKLRGQGHFVDFVMRKEAARARHAVVG